MLLVVRFWRFGAKGIWSSGLMLMLIAPFLSSRPGPSTGEFSCRPSLLLSPTSVDPAAVLNHRTNLNMNQSTRPF